MNRHSQKTRSPEARGFAAGLAPGCLWWILAACHAFAAPVVVVHLRNGDRITGELVRETDELLVLKSVFAGKIPIQKPEILRRESVAPAVPKPVRTAAAPAPSPAPTPAPGGGPLAKTNAPALVAVPGFLDGAWLRPFATNWHGNVGLGMNLGFGTTDRQTFFANANAIHTWQRVINNISYSAAYGFVNQIEAANRMDGVLKTDVYVGPQRRLYAYNQVLGGYDEIRLIRMRWEEGVGMGYRVYDHNHLAISGELGGQYQRFAYTSQSDRSIWSARIGETLVWKPSDKFAITQRMHFLPNVTDLSDYRARFELIASYPLFKKITVSFNVTDEYESRPANHVDSNDLQITTNVNIVF